MAEETTNLPVVNAIGRLQRTSSSGDIQISNVLSGGFNRLSRGIFGLQDSFIDISQRQQEFSQQQMLAQEQFFSESIQATVNAQRGLNLLNTIFTFMTTSQTQELRRLTEQRDSLQAQNIDQQGKIITVTESVQAALEKVTDQTELSQRIMVKMSGVLGQSIETFTLIKSRLDQLIKRFDQMLILNGEMVRMSAKSRMDTMKTRLGAQQGLSPEQVESIWEGVKSQMQGLKFNEVEQAKKTFGPYMEGLINLQGLQKRVEEQVESIRAGVSDSTESIIVNTRAKKQEAEATERVVRAKQREEQQIRETIQAQSWWEKVKEDQEKNQKFQASDEVRMEQARAAAWLRFQNESPLVKNIIDFIATIKQERLVKKLRGEDKVMQQQAETEIYGIGAGKLGILRLLASPLLWKTAIAGFSAYGLYKIGSGFMELFDKNKQKERQVERKEFLESRGLEADNWKRNLLGPLEGLFKSSNKELEEIQAYHREGWEEGNSSWFTALKEWWEGIINWWRGLRLNPFSDANAATPDQVSAPTAPRTPSEMVVPKRNDGAAVNGASSAAAAQTSQPIIVDGSRGGDVTNIDQSVNTKVQMPKNVGFTKPMAPDSSGMYGRNFGWLGP